MSGYMEFLDTPELRELFFEMVVQGLVLFGVAGFIIGAAFAFAAGYGDDVVERWRQRRKARRFEALAAREQVTL